jgi:catechol 2,3-dioxygenase-like lactoylglutathione lyase family enzyme
VTHAFQSARDVIIRTESWSAAVRFYESVLGWLVVHRDKGMVGFETGSFRLYVEQGKAHGPVFEYLVPDVQFAKAHLLAAGCVLVEEDASVPRCYVRDPQGVVFNIGQAPV